VFRSRKNPGGWPWADMLNAGRQGDLLELRLDGSPKRPTWAELLAAKPKPVIMTCRRSQDGGQWQGPEEERLAFFATASSARRTMSRSSWTLPIKSALPRQQAGHLLHESS